MSTPSSPPQPSQPSPQSQSQISIRPPSKHTPTTPDQTSTYSPGPPLEFLHRQWTVTHSTLPMWRKAKNVRITYTPLPALHTNGGDLFRLGDLVESVPTEKTWLPQPKRIEGVDTAVMEVGEGGESTGRVRGWKWSGRGWVKVAGGSYWEILGWGERPGEGEGKERWVVTWFESTMFTPSGVDVYCDCKGGISEELFGEIEEALGKVEGGGVGELCGRELRKVLIDDA